MVANAIAALTVHHEGAPWMLGATSLQLARQLALDEPALVPMLGSAVAAGQIDMKSGYYAVPGFSAALNPEQKAFFDAVVPSGSDPAHVPVLAADVAAAIRQSAVPGMTTAFDMLEATGVLARVGAHLYRGDQLRAIHERIQSTIRSTGPITAAQARDAIGLSRKYVVPLLEFFDAARVTIRDGDLRTLR